MKTTQSIQKFKLIPIEHVPRSKNDPVLDINGIYNKLRNWQYAQYRALNIAMGYLASGYFLADKDIKSDLFKEHQKTMRNTNPIFNNIDFEGYQDIKSFVNRKVKNDFSIALKNGLARGERKLPEYKRTFPLYVKNRDIHIYYESDKKDSEILLKWKNIIFKISTWSKHNSQSKNLQHILHKIINGEYKISDSSIMFDKNNKLILNLNHQVPIQEKILDAENILGVDIGINVPIYAVVVNDPYKKATIGDKGYLIKHKVQFKERYNKLQKGSIFAKGGKGRNKKLRALNHLKQKESNFTKTFNHTLSKELINFAVKNGCGTIHMEKLISNGFDDRLLRNWTYYQLQNMIEYKADRVGIKIKYVDPCYTSQTCSICGNVDKENRKTQESFKCTKCGYSVNADFNACVNIGKSDKFIK